MQKTPEQSDDINTQHGCVERGVREVCHRVEHLPAESQGDNTGIAVAERTAVALDVLATSISQLAEFVTNGGLVAALNGFAKTQAVKEILGGLAAHEGRKSLDARVLTQNALEIVEAIEKVHDKYSERLQEKALRDPEIKAVQEEPDIKYLKNGEPVK